MPSVAYARERAAVARAEECSPAREMSWRTKLWGLLAISSTIEVWGGEGDGEPMLSHVPDEGSEGGFVEAVACPVEGGAEVVDELLAREGGADLGGEGSGFGDGGVGGLEPEEVGVGGEGEGALGGCGEAGKVVVEAFARAGDVPAEGDGGVGAFVC